MGHGDPSTTLQRRDPLLLTGFIEATQATGVPLMLLHTYPFHREAGYLAQVYAHVPVDVGSR